MSGNVEASVRWLDRVDAHPPAQELKRRMLELCPVGAGDRILDVGCGLGRPRSRRHLPAEVAIPREVVVQARLNGCTEARRRASSYAA